MWAIEVYQPGQATPIAEFANARRRTIRESLNRVPIASFDLDIHDVAVTSDLINAGYSQIKIRKNNTYIFGGVLVEPVAQGTPDGGSIQVTSFGYGWWLKKSLFNSSFTALSTGYAATDIGQIIKGFIDDCQAQTYKAFGLTEGTITASKAVDRSVGYYKPLTPIWEAIENFTKVQNGPDFWIEPDKRYFVGYPRRGADKSATIELVYPGVIQSFGYSENAVDLATKVHVRGEGTDDAALVETVQDDVQSAQYFELESVKPYGATTSAALQDYGNGILDERKKPIVSIDKVTFIAGLQGAPKVGTFWVGDIIRLKIAWGNYLEINAKYRVEEISLELTDNDTEIFTLGVSRVKQ